MKMLHASLRAGLGAHIVTDTKSNYLKTGPRRTPSMDIRHSSIAPACGGIGVCAGCERTVHRRLSSGYVNPE